MPTQHSRVRKILIFPMIARDELNRFLESASPSDSHVYFEGTALSLGDEATPTEADLRS